MEQNKEHAMTAKEIAAELEKLIETEKAEAPKENDDHVKDLEDALALVEKFAADEDAETEVSEPSGKVIDTGVLTGPINGLKNFLIKKSADNEAK